MRSPTPLPRRTAALDCRWSPTGRAIVRFEPTDHPPKKAANPSLAAHCDCSPAPDRLRITAGRSTAWRQPNPTTIVAFLKSP